jgi:hypothetical protein
MRVALLGWYITRSDSRDARRRQGVTGKEAKRSRMAAKVDGYACRRNDCAAGLHFRPSTLPVTVRRHSRSQNGARSKRVLVLPPSQAPLFRSSGCKHRFHALLTGSQPAPHRLHRTPSS